MSFRPRTRADAFALSVIPSTTAFAIPAAIAAGGGVYGDLATASQRGSSGTRGLVADDGAIETGARETVTVGTITSAGGNGATVTAVSKVNWRAPTALAPSSTPENIGSATPFGQRLFNSTTRRVASGSLQPPYVSRWVLCTRNPCEPSGLLRTRRREESPRKALMATKQSDPGSGTAPEYSIT